MNLTSMRIMVLPALLAACHVSAIAAAQSTETVEAEVHEKAVKRFHPRKIERLVTRLFDGVKGTIISATSDNLIESTPEQRSRTLRNMACNGSVFGIVKLEARKTFVGKDDRGVFTRFRFRVLDDWRAAPDSKKGQIVHLVMEAGEVKHKGETVRIENARADYQVNASYLLAAGSRFNQDEGSIFYDHPPLIEVVDGILQPIPGSLLFASGTPVRAAKAEVANATPAGSCN